MNDSDREHVKNVGLSFWLLLLVALKRENEMNQVSSCTEDKALEAIAKSRRC